MRVVDQLIRQLTNARLVAIRDDFRSDDKAVVREVAIADLPASVRKAVERIRAMDKERRGLEKLITAAGFSAYQASREYTELGRTAASADIASAKKRMEQRIGRVEALKANALLDTIGTSPAEAKEALRVFRAAILKV